MLKGVAGKGDNDKVNVKGTRQETNTKEKDAQVVVVFAVCDVSTKGECENTKCIGHSPLGA